MQRLVHRSIAPALLVLALAPPAHAQQVAAPAVAVAPSAAAAPASATRPAASPPPPPPPPPDVGVTLRADDGRATLERRASVQSFAGFPLPDASLGGVETWEPACAAPCASRLDPRFSYRVSGDGLVPSSPFTLPPGRESVVVDARMGSSYGRVGGLALGGAGLGALLLGGAALVATPILEDRSVGSPELRTGVLAGGVGLVGAGVLAVSAGLWLWLHNGTRVLTF